MKVFKVFDFKKREYWAERNDVEPPAPSGSTPQKAGKDSSPQAASGSSPLAGNTTSRPSTPSWSPKISADPESNSAHKTPQRPPRISMSIEKSLPTQTRELTPPPSNDHEIANGVHSMLNWRTKWRKPSLKSLSSERETDRAQQIQQDSPQRDSKASDKGKLPAETPTSETDADHLNGLASTPAQRVGTSTESEGANSVPEGTRKRYSIPRLLSMYHIKRSPKRPASPASFVELTATTEKAGWIRPKHRKSKSTGSIIRVSIHDDTMTESGSSKDLSSATMTSSSGRLELVDGSFNDSIEVVSTAPPDSGTSPAENRLGKLYVHGSLYSFGNASAAVMRRSEDLRRTTSDPSGRPPLAPIRLSRSKPAPPIQGKFPRSPSTARPSIDSQRSVNSVISAFPVASSSGASQHTAEDPIPEPPLDDLYASEEEWKKQVRSPIHIEEMVERLFVSPQEETSVVAPAAEPPSTTATVQPINVILAENEEKRSIEDIVPTLEISENKEPEEIKRNHETAVVPPVSMYQKPRPTSAPVTPGRPSASPPDAHQQRRRGLPSPTQIRPVAGSSSEGGNRSSSDSIRPASIHTLVCGATGGLARRNSQASATSSSRIPVLSRGMSSNGVEAGGVVRRRSSAGRRKALRKKWEKLSAMSGLSVEEYGERLRRMKDKQGFMCEVDGLLIHGGQLLSGMKELINWMRTENKRFTFVTNHSALTPRELSAKLARLGLSIPESQFFTSALATARFLKTQRPRGGSCYCIGEPGLTYALYESGFEMNEERPDFVVVGECRSFNFEKISRAVQLVYGGAKLVGTNHETTTVNEKGDQTFTATGAICKMIEVATGRKAFYCGMPSSLLIRYAQEQLGVRSEEICIVGNQLESGMLAGTMAQIDTVFVASDHTSSMSSQLMECAYGPYLVVASCGDILT
ncbi:hypothetical protein BJ742DRAFT_548901 [Cladochytrium replicatum]|nr:hypothetical protein BJ742DRAFT_548901 [Cladochytrium replicatum]